MNELQSLLDNYDCFAWIPTIRGSLSLDLITDADEILGDVDKYSVEIKNYKGLHSEHYVAATSLLTVSDSKSGDDYLRSFRYVFVGTINEEKRNNDYLGKYNLARNEKIVSYLSNKGMLLGHLIIIVENPNGLTSDEAELLKEFRELSGIMKEYRTHFYVNASSMGKLAEKRNAAIRYWNNIELIVARIEKNEKQENKYPVYSFDTLLTRDGILLLKDVTQNISDKQTYAEAGTLNDYTCNVPLHRLFKVAMNYMKYLFHSNYHHNQEHDTYLPASNLHPAKNGDSFDLTRIFRHQMEAFLAPVVKLKRKGFKDYTIDANGILLYTKAFVNVFKHNNLIAEAEIKRAEDFLAVQEKEVDYMQQTRKSLISTVLSQRNFLFITSGILAFIVAVLKIATTFIDFKKVKLSDWASWDMHIIGLDIFILIIIIVVGLCFYLIPSSLVLKNRFKPKKMKRKWFFKDSDIEKKKLSWWYAQYIKCSGKKLSVSISGWQCLKIVVSAILFAACFFAIYVMYGKLT